MDSKKPNVDQLIESLSENLAPVKPVKPVWMQWSMWAFASLLILLFFFYAFHLHFTHYFPYEDYIFESLLLLSGWMFGGWFILSMGVPCERKQKTILLPLLPFIMYIFFIFGRFLNVGIQTGHWVVTPKVSCVQTMFLFGFVPLVLLVMFCKRGVPIHHRFMGFVIGLTVAFLGNFALQFLCPIRDLSHMMFSHILPILFIGVIVHFGVSWVLFRK